MFFAGDLVPACTTLVTPDIALQNIRNKASKILLFWMSDNIFDCVQMGCKVFSQTETNIDEIEN